MARMRLTTSPASDDGYKAIEREKLRGVEMGHLEGIGRRFDRRSLDSVRAGGESLAMDEPLMSIVLA